MKTKKRKHCQVTVARTDMSFPSLLVYLCVCVAGSHVKNCTQAVLAKREEISSPSGSTLFLTCVVQHCGGVWGGSWVRKNSSSEQLQTVSSSTSHTLSSMFISPSKTQLMLKLQSINKSDEGSYGCRIKWGTDASDQGNLIHVLVTTDTVDPAPLRKPWHRVLVCFSVFLCLLFSLLLARWLSSRTAASQEGPHPLHRALLRAPEAEPVYADISQDALSSQRAASRESEQPTIYASVRLS